MSKPGSKQIEVQIMGQSYLLSCPPGGEASLLDAVERVDTAMCRIRDAGKVKARDRIAVLASLNLAFELSQKEAESFQASSFAQAENSAFAEAGGGFDNDPLDPQTQARVEELMRRLDQTLDKDGRLL
ncbi:cell division protein ZapA [Hydrogenophaga sp.]|jgi:cell division protein ZapA|uniref:cell division protein ZapA n=1 Tax=Hydrogenophaga sp. TaxID=1904254 RepID=UPI002625C57D|nr:cell division protein ZapA [Hydrogenophaga sp.]MCV0440219.1 cell division protein ZapA [Hydrogenophaga sp.]